MEILDALGNIGFDWRIAMANFINFVIIYFLLNKFVFKPLASNLEERSQKIKDGLQHAEDAKSLKSKATEERDQMLLEARQEANKIVTAAKDKETDTISGAADKAAVQADKILAEAREKTAAEHDVMLATFRAEAGELVVAAAEKLLKDDITATEKKSIASRYLKNVPIKSPKNN
jgi:F-type H+-transporting ATPase subunit b